MNSKTILGPYISWSDNYFFVQVNVLVQKGIFEEMISEVTFDLKHEYICDVLITYS